MPKDYGYGIIPFTKTDNKGLNFLVIQHLAGHWGLPKGHKEEGESDIDAAKREFTEETGISDFNIVDNEPCVSENYVAFSEKYGQVDKSVCYYIAEVSKPTLKIQEEEIMDAKWCDYETALDLLTHDSIKKVFSQAFDRIQNNESI